MSTLWLLLLIAVSAPIYIRFAPLKPEAYHAATSAKATGDWPMAGGFEAVRAGATATTLADLNALILSSPRTRVLAGALDEGHVSYVTRSRLWGFPDITNVWLQGDRLHIRGHLVYGRSDLGVNRARIEGWLADLALPES